MAADHNELVSFCNNQKVPAYTFLPHTLTQGKGFPYQDLVEESRTAKLGYDMVHLGVDQAAIDGIENYLLD